jgi:hypothetical protein
MREGKSIGRGFLSSEKRRAPAIGAQGFRCG